ncbi:MAG: hypothetical protein BWZ03_00213 [bacterium ADurb.BinA186]|nr:MAG: hypothetical protein BWZ03_00213 [bacterium ADurb.BinA186]
MLERYEHCQTPDCAVYRALSLLTLGLFVGDSDFMKESVLKAIEALKTTYPNEKNLGQKVVMEFLAPMLAKLSEKNRRISLKDMQEFKELIKKQAGSSSLSK